MNLFFIKMDAWPIPVRGKHFKWCTSVFWKQKVKSHLREVRGALIILQHRGGNLELLGAAIHLA